MTEIKKGVCVSKPLLFALIGLSLLPICSAKEFTVDRELIFRKKIHLHLNTPISFTPRAKTDFSHPDFKQDFYPSANFSLGLTGLYNFNTRYSLSIGFNLLWFSFSSLRDQFFIPKKYEELYVSHDPQNYISDPGLMSFKRFNPYKYFWALPICFVHRIPVTPKMDFCYSLGLNFKLFLQFRYLASGRFYDVNNDSLPIAYYMQYNISPNHNRSFKMDALFSAGINRYLKNNKYINCNFFINVPMYKPLLGEFGFLLDTPYEARGTFKKSDLALGFEFNYVFSFVKKNKHHPISHPAID